MNGRGPVYCKPHQVGTAQQTIWIKRGGTSSSGSGRSGWKLRPSAMLAHALSEMARNRRAVRRVTGGGNKVSQ